MTMSAPKLPVVILGAGVGGLCTAIRLSAQGFTVTLLEKEAAVGGKMRRVAVGDTQMDAGPTVLTMRWVFDELFRDVGARLEDYVELAPLDVLARHHWPDGSCLDLFSDRQRSAEAIQAFAGPREADGYLAFCDYAARIYETVESPFLRASLPSAVDLFSFEGMRLAASVSRIDATRTMWKAIGGYFRDERLRMLFGRYATYTGSSPWQAPATLNSIAFVEQAGAWVVRGGMYALAEGLLRLAQERGVVVQTNAEVAEILLDDTGRAAGVRLRTSEIVPAVAVVSNGDSADLERLIPAARPGQLPKAPKERSLSALVFTLTAHCQGTRLAHHNVFFPKNYRQEFHDLFDTGCLPEEPTVYVCAQDRGPFGSSFQGPDERLLLLVNAPADGERRDYSPQETDAWATKILTQLRHMGLHITPTAGQVTTPRDFARLSPATGGALYGPASHGLMSAFARPPCRMEIPGLYGVGGSVHPGAGVPMVALSASICARALAAELPSMIRSRPVATLGGTSMVSVNAGVTPLRPSSSLVRFFRPLTSALRNAVDIMARRRILFIIAPSTLCCRKKVVPLFGPSVKPRPLPVTRSGWRSVGRR